jgi:hypothetical protein
VVLQKLAKSNTKRESVGSLLGHFDNQDRPIMQQTQLLEPSRPRQQKKHRFYWPRGSNIVELVFWRGPEWPSVAGAVHLW